MSWGARYQSCVQPACFVWLGCRHVSIADYGSCSKLNRDGDDLCAVPQRRLPARLLLDELRTVIVVTWRSRLGAGKGESHGFRHHGGPESME